MVRMNRSPYFHHDHVAALRLADSIEAGRLVVGLVKTGVVGALPPAVRALEGSNSRPHSRLYPSAQTCQQSQASCTKERFSSATPPVGMTVR